MFSLAAECIRCSHARLSELDRVGGDGDHGTTMLRVADRLERAIDPVSTENLQTLLRSTGWAVMGVDGGASSALLGTFFSGMADAPLCHDSLDCGELSGAFEAGLKAVSRQTKAVPGDKTMMDALVPGVAAFRFSAIGNNTIPESMKAAVTAAQAGAKVTSDLIARYGRAKLLGEKTRGYPDAGATSVSLIFEGFSAANLSERKM